MFVRSLIEDNAGAVVAVVATVTEHRAALVNPPKTPAEYLAMLERQHTTERVAVFHGFVDGLPG